MLALTRGQFMWKSNLDWRCHRRILSVRNRERKLVEREGMDVGGGMGASKRYVNYTLQHTCKYFSVKKRSQQCNVAWGFLVPFEMACNAARRDNLVVPCTVTHNDPWSFLRINTWFPLLQGRKVFFSVATYPRGSLGRHLCNPLFFALISAQYLLPIEK